VKVPDEAIVPVLVLPLPATAPLHEPEAVQEVGLLVVLQLRVELLPVPILAGDIDIVTTGAIAPPAPEVTLTVVFAALLPPALEQLRV